jgi:hypothetical protein
MRVHRVYNSLAQQLNGQEVVVYKMGSKWSNVKLQASIRCVLRPVS